LNIMKKYFTPNLEIKGRIVRGFIAVVVLLTATVAFPFSMLLSLPLAAIGLFVLFEAFSGWCALRACGIRTRL
jgi:hypothetical protein